MPSPRIAVALAAFCGAAFATLTPALADDTSDRAAAIAACRTAVAQELAVQPGDLTLDQIATKARFIELRLEARSNGAKVAADCTFARRARTTTVAVVGAPARQAAVESATAANR